MENNLQGKLDQVILREIAQVQAKSILNGIITLAVVGGIGVPFGTLIVFSAVLFPIGASVVGALYLLFMYVLWRRILRFHYQSKLIQIYLHTSFGEADEETRKAFFQNLLKGSVKQNNF